MIYIHPTALGYDCLLSFKEDYNLDAVVVDGKARLMVVSVSAINQKRIKEYEHKKSLLKYNINAKFDLKIY